jgi:dihydroorotase
MENKNISKNNTSKNKSSANKNAANKTSAKFKKPNLKGNKNPLFLTNARIIDPETGFDKKGSLLVENGKIVDFGAVLKAPQNAKIIDCKGNILSPSFIDISVHTGEPGGCYKENIYFTSKAAVAGGVTTINIMPDVSPVIDSTNMVEFIKNRALEKAYCNVTIFGAITKGLKGKEIAEIGLMHKAGVKGISDGNNSIHDALVMRRALEYSSNFGLTLTHFAQDKHLGEGGVLNEGAVSTKLGVRGIPNAAETIIIERDLALVELTGGSIHFLHISTPEAILAVKRAKEKGLKVTCSTTAHHLSLTETEAFGFRTYAKTQPPLRSEASRKAIIKGLKDGVIDFITSDHSPRSSDQKRLTLQSSEFGVIGLETLFSASYTKLLQAGLKLPEILNYLTVTPAKFLGDKSRGRIKKGCVADLVVIDIDKKFIVKPENFFGKAKNTPFDGVELSGKIIKTFVSGELVYEA